MASAVECEISACLDIYTKYERIQFDYCAEMYQNLALNPLMFYWPYQKIVHQKPHTRCLYFVKTCGLNTPHHFMQLACN